MKCMIIGKWEGRELYEEKADKLILALPPVRSVSCPFLKVQ